MDYYVTVIGKNHQACSQLVELQGEGVRLDFIIAPDGAGCDYHLILQGVTESVVVRLSGSISLVFLVKHLCTDEIAKECSTQFYRLPKANTKFRYYTDSCALVLHEPTGILAKSEGHRSKWHNQTEALNIIMSKLVATVA